MEIERNEAELLAARGEVQKKESSESSTKAALAKALSSLTSQAETAEEKSREVAISANRVSAEVRSLLPAVEFLFHTLAAGEAVAGPVDGSAGAPAKTSASMKMYNSPALQLAVREQAPPTASLLPSFMGILENRSADIIQLYAAMLTAGQIRDGGDVLDAEAAMEEEARDDDAALKAAAAGAEALVENEAVAAAPAEAPLPDLPTKRFISPAALGPSKPMGGLKESLTTSALVAAMSATATTGVAAGGEGGVGAAGGAAGATRRGATGRAEAMPSMRRGAVEEEEEEAAGKAAVIRPYTLDELKRQAVASITADRSVPAIKSAATSAAGILGRGSS